MLSKKWSRFTESDVVIAWDLLDSLYAVCTFANFGHEKMHACALITYDAVIQSRSSMLSYIQSHSARLSMHRNAYSLAHVNAC